VIRGWLGHVSLEITNRYAEITVRMKEAAMKLCEPPTVGRDRGKAGWRDDTALLHTIVGTLKKPSSGRSGVPRSPWLRGCRVTYNLGATLGARSPKKL
jgi:hypothetical protein